MYLLFDFLGKSCFKNRKSIILKGLCLFTDHYNHNHLKLIFYNINSKKKADNFKINFTNCAGCCQGKAKQV